MKTKIFVFFAVAIVAMACEQVEPPNIDGIVVEANSRIVMEAGYYRSNVGALLVEKDVATGLTVSSADSTNKIVEVLWTIEGKTYKELNIFYKFTSLGIKEVKVWARFAEGDPQTKVFLVEVVADLAAVGPLVIQANKNTDGSYDLWFGWDKRWTKAYADTIWSINGNVTKWTLTGIANKSYVLNNAGQPVLTSDVGKYLGTSLSLSAAGAYNIALVAKNGDWINITGSPYARANDTGLAHFQLNADGTITPQGDANPPSSTDEWPGDSGDTYFRFNQTADTMGVTNLFFHLDSTWTNKSFVVREGRGGLYGAPIRLLAVDDFPEWGRLEIPLSELTEEVSGWRYGANIDTPNTYAENMKKSIFYDGYFKNLRLFLVQLQAVKKGN